LKRKGGKNHVQKEGEKTGNLTAKGSKMTKENSYGYILIPECLRRGLVPMGGRVKKKRGENLIQEINSSVVRGLGYWATKDLSVPKRSSALNAKAHNMTGKGF